VTTIAGFELSLNSWLTESSNAVSSTGRLNVSWPRAGLAAANQNVAAAHAQTNLLSTAHLPRRASSVISQGEV
jgi:hypothetical protein